MKHNYDIFISYRRSSYETANLIATRLKSAGYRVFFDLESMRSGPFNEQLFNVIEGCRDFVIVLPPDALERCSNEEDWVRKEVLCAMSHKKNIIPVMLSGFVWPNPMPQGMEELRNYQAVAAGSIEYFDMSMKRLESYLSSTRHTKQRIFAKWFILSTLSIAAILLSLFFVFRSIAKPLCKEFAQHQTLYAGIADFLIDDNKKLAVAMDEYKSNSNKDDLFSQIDVIKSNIEYYKSNSIASVKYTAWQKFLLSLYGINEFESHSVNEHLSTMYMFINETIELITELTTETEDNNLFPSELKLIDMSFKELTHLGNILYYSYLQIISKLPESVLEESNEVRSKFVNMPKTVLGAKESEYEILIKQEFEQLSGYVSEMNEDNKKAEDELYKSEIKLDSLNNVYLKKLLEYDSTNVQDYDEIKKMCTIQAADEQGLKWLKIRYWGGFLNDISLVYYGFKELNAGKEASINPMTAYSNIKSMLTTFEECYPESKDYVASAKQFFIEIAEGKREYSGVTIHAIYGDETHAIFKKGDIIIGYDGNEIKNLEELKTAYTTNDKGDITFLRLTDGKFVEHKKQITDTDIVGFLDLTEQI